MAQGQNRGTTIATNQLQACKVEEVLHNNDQEGFIRFTSSELEGIDKSTFGTKGVVAKPLFPFLKYTPIEGEQVIIINLNNSDPGDNRKPQVFYLPVVNIFNGVNHNIYSNYESLKEDKGKYFKEQDLITPLFPLEGDFILEGRFGNSIRMGGSGDPDKLKDTITNPRQSKTQKTKEVPWSNSKDTVSDPIIIISNEQNPPIPERGTSYIENIDRDGSSIYLTSTQNISNLDDIYPSGLWPPKSMKNQIGREVLSSEDYSDMQTSLYTDEDISDNIGGDSEYSIYENPTTNTEAEDQFNLDNAEGTGEIPSQISYQADITGSDGKSADEGLSMLDQIMKNQNNISENSFIEISDSGDHENDKFYSEDELLQLEKEWKSEYKFTPNDLNGAEKEEYINPATNQPWEWADKKAVIGQWHDGSNFTVYHATKTGTGNDSQIRSEKHFLNIQNVFKTFLKPLAKRYGKGSFLVSSIYRPWLANNSAHTGGLAADIVGETINIADIFDFFYDKFGASSLMRQLIFEFPGEGSEHIHVAFGSPRSKGQFKATARNSTWANFLGINQYESRDDYDTINPDIINLYSRNYKPNSSRPISPTPSNKNINTKIYTDLNTM
tara:strand:- start:2204 stop:4033 length:1830 start_codon:yes stop_codon:yes gene_type:complete